jgi:hypothetical protein
LFAIRFKNLDAKNHYWYYPDAATRDTDYALLDSITGFGGGGSSSNPNGSTAAHQLTILARLQEIVDNIELKFDNRTTNYNDLRGVIQPFVTNTSYSGDYKLKDGGTL